MYGEPDIVLSFIRYAYWVMSVEADVCNYCKFVFDMARFTYTSINYTRGTSLRSEVPLVFVCSKSSTRVGDYNAPLKVGCSKSIETKVSGSALAAEICAGPHNRLLRRQHCSSLCSQSEGHEHVANMALLDFQPVLGRVFKIQKNLCAFLPNNKRRSMRT